MTTDPAPKRVLLVTGLSGAGKSTVLRTLEDLGWEVVDNLPLSLLDRLISTPHSTGLAAETRPLALGLDARTRGFDAERIVRQVERLAQGGARPLEVLFLDCAGTVLLQRFSATRRRHPLAPDRPATDGIAAERELLAPLKRWADHFIDTTDTDAHALTREVRRRFAVDDLAPMLTLLSFSYARGLPRNADLVLDMRFLRNPHWVPGLREKTGREAEVGAYIAGDPAYADAMARIGGLLTALLPRYRAEGKAYISIAFGCTGGRHRSVHVAEHMGQVLRAAGFSPTVEHRDLASPPRDMIEGAAEARV